MVLVMRNFSDEVVEQIKTQDLRSITFFPENRAVRDMMWKHGAADSPQVTITQCAFSLNAGQVGL
jgi:hypothetical protein